MTIESPTRPAGAIVERDFNVVVIGLGYVGLPLVIACVEAGIDVAGFDADPSIVSELLSGKSHIPDVGDVELAGALDSSAVLTENPGVIRRASHVILCVPTPLGDDRRPDLSAVTKATHTVAQNLSHGTTVILESTSYPGTTDEIVLPILETSGLTAGVDFHVAFSPERTDPGNQTHDRRNTPKIVGGHTPECGIEAKRFYERFVDEVVLVRGTREAEMAKVFENAYRLVNISLVNEMLVLATKLGIDFAEVLEAAATKPFGFMRFNPGPGAGGHCIPVDPMYLAFKADAVGYPLAMVGAAASVNAAMPEYVAARGAEVLERAGVDIEHAQVLILGVAYKENVGDTRETPAAGLVRSLLERRARVTYHDPHVRSWPEFDSLISRDYSVAPDVSSASLVVVLQHHAIYEKLDFTQARVVLDARGRLRGPNIVHI